MLFNSTRLRSYSLYTLMALLMAGCAGSVDQFDGTATGTTSAGGSGGAQHLYAYVSAIGQDTFNHVYTCPLGTNYSFAYCAVTDANESGTWDPISTTVQAFDGANYVYVSDQTNGIVYQCSINANFGNLTTCTANNGGVTVGAWQPEGVSFATVGGTTYGYVSDLNGDIYVCTVNSGSGAFGTCTASNWNTLTSAANPLAEMTFGTFNGTTYGYVGASDGNVYRCAIDVSTGVLDTCGTNNGGASSWLPHQVKFATLGQNTFGYVVDDDSNVYQCSVDGSGNLGSCTASTGVPSWAPNGMTTSTLSGVTYAFISDQTNGNIDQCTLDSISGAVTSCAPNNGGETWSPVGSISFY
jgi:hypothetical protein